MKKLILFTASFPFGKKETYLETEIKYLSKSFDEVFIYPHYYNNNDTSIRKTPENVFVSLPVLPNNKFIRLFISIKGLIFNSKSFFLKDFFNKKVYKSFTNLYVWIIQYINYLATISSDEFKTILVEKNSIFYFYWGSGWANILPNLLNNNNVIFMRLHGSEVYLERSNGYIPVRKYVFDKVNLFLSISNHLSEYLKDIYDIEEKKILLSRLGVMPNNKTINNQKNPKNKKIIIVSCSNLIRLKRIDLIIDALFHLNGVEIEWTHFGDGPLMSSLQNRVKSLPFKKVKINFKGRIDNIRIFQFYRENHIDAFINVSKYEGLPVSIMEAMSFGIPTIASNAGATSEIVNESNGILLENNLNKFDLSTSILKIKESGWNKKRENAFKTWNSKFNAHSNYNKLINFLKNEKS